MVNVVFIIIIIILAKIILQEINKLKYRLNKLEKNLQELSLNLKSKEITEKATLEQTSTSAIPTLTSSSSPPPPPIISTAKEFPKDRSIKSFIDWLKENWIMKVGALFLILAFFWFITYAFKNNLIGPQGRIVIGFIFGLFFLFIGSKVIKNYPVQGTVLTILGLTIVIISSYAGQILYNFFNHLVSLSFIFLTSTYIAITSYIYGTPFLASLSLIISSIAPLIVNYSIYNIDFIFIYIYLTAITICYLLLSLTTNNKYLAIINLLIIFFYSFITVDIQPFFFTILTPAEMQVILKLVYLLIFLFFTTNIIEIIRISVRDYAPKETTTIFTSAIFNSLLLIYWINNVADEQWRVFILTIWSLLFIAAAYYLYQATRQKLGVYIYSATSLVVINNALYILLTDVSLLITLIIEATCLCFASYAALKNIKLTTFISYILFIFLIFSLPYFATNQWYKIYHITYPESNSPIITLPEAMLKVTSWNERIFHDSFFVITILMLAFTLVALFFKKINVNQKIYLPHSLAALSILLYLIWSISHALLITTNLENENIKINIYGPPPNFYNPPETAGYFLATIVSLTIYVLIGLGLYIYGLKRSYSVVKRTGAFLILFVIARILIVDTLSLSIERKIIVFFIIGLILLASAIFEIKKRYHESSPK